MHKTSGVQESGVQTIPVSDVKGVKANVSSANGLSSELLSEAKTPELLNY